MVEYKGFKPSNVLQKQVNDYINLIKLLGGQDIECNIWVGPEPSFFPIKFSDQDFPTQMDDNRKYPTNYFLDAPNSNKQNWKKSQIVFRIPNPHNQEYDLKYDVGYQTLTTWQDCLRAMFGDALDRAIRGMQYYKIPVTHLTSIIRVKLNAI